MEHDNQSNVADELFYGNESHADPDQSGRWMGPLLVLAFSFNALVCCGIFNAVSNPDIQTAVRGILHLP